MQDTVMDFIKKQNNNDNNKFSTIIINFSWGCFHFSPYVVRLLQIEMASLFEHNLK